MLLSCFFKILPFLSVYSASVCTGKSACLLWRHGKVELGDSITTNIKFQPCWCVGREEKHQHAFITSVTACLASQWLQETSRPSRNTTDYWSQRITSPKEETQDINKKITGDFSDRPEAQADHLVQPVGSTASDTETAQLPHWSWRRGRKSTR